MSVPSSWAIRYEKLGGRRVDKYGKGDPGASQSEETSQICGLIGAGLGRVDQKGVTVTSGQSSYVGRGGSLLSFRGCSRGLQDLLNIKASSLTHYSNPDHVRLVDITAMLLEISLRFMLFRLVSSCPLTVQEFQLLGPE